VKDKYSTKYYKGLKEIIKTYRLFENLKIIDIGSGTGKTIKLFKTPSNKVWGLDISDRRNDTYSDSYEFICGNALNIPFKDSFFDLVVSFDVIEHIEDDVKFMKEIIRVLKKDGKIVIGTPNRLRISNRIQKLSGREIKFPRCYGTNSNLGDIVHLREYTIDELKELIEENGGSVLAVKSVLLGGYLFGDKGQGFLWAPGFLSNFGHHLFMVAKKK
jgi:SAM-dependent methyltransferase